MKSQVKYNHYFIESYDSKERFISYWHQIKEIINLKPKNVLEIGIGNGFVSKYLKERGINLTTLDIDQELKPNIIGTVLNIPFTDDLFDLIACYEALEHLPYVKVKKTISEICRVSKFFTILSLPDTNRVYRFNVQIPKIGEIKKLIPLPQLRQLLHKFDGQHYWEIGKKGYPLNRVTNDIKNVGFKIIKTYRVFENPYHRFFVLKKRETIQ